MKPQINIDQLRADLDSLSIQDFEIKYPGLESKALKDLTAEELEQRVSKAWGFSLPGNPFGRTG